MTQGPNSSGFPEGMQPIPGPSTPPYVGITPVEAELHQKIEDVQSALQQELNREEKELGKIYKKFSDRIQADPENGEEIAKQGNQQISKQLEDFFDRLTPGAREQLVDIGGNDADRVADAMKRKLASKYTVAPEPLSLPLSAEEKESMASQITQGMQDAYGPDANISNAGMFSAQLKALVEAFEKAPSAIAADDIFSQIQLVLSGAAPTGLSSPNSLPSKIDDLMKAAMGQGFSGSVMVVQNGQTVFTQGYGEASAGNPNTSDTTYHWDSMSKVVTATAMLQLKEQGLVDLDAPITDYLPGKYQNSPGLGGSPPVTIRELLNMTSGVAMPPASNWLDHPPSLNDMLDYVAQHPRTGQGTIAYSNTGYNVLAYILQQVAHQSYGQYVQENIFDPAGMATASAPATLRDDHPEAHLHTWDAEGHRQPATSDQYPDYTSMRIGTGNINGSVLDAEKFNEALNNGTLISPDDLALMQTPDGQGARFGWDPGAHSVNGHSFIQKSGAQTGEQNYIMRFPDSDTMIVITSNVDPKPPLTPDTYLQPLAIAIAQLLFSK